jgi:hypothetical protein
MGLQPQTRHLRNTLTLARSRRQLDEEPMLTGRSESPHGLGNKRLSSPFNPAPESQLNWNCGTQLAMNGSKTPRSPAGP